MVLIIYGDLSDSHSTVEPLAEVMEVMEDPLLEVEVEVMGAMGDPLDMDMVDLVVLQQLPLQDHLRVLILSE